jgi:hypothetical protein
MDGGRAYEIRGQVVRTPVRLRDAAAGAACFHVPVHVARRVVDQAFEPVNVGYGHTRLQIYFVHHRDSDLGACHNAGIAVWVRPARNPSAEPGHYFVVEAVDEMFSRDAARVIWGYPKVIAEVTIQYYEEHAVGRLAMDGRHVFTLTVPRRGSDSSTDRPVVSYTVLNDLPHKTLFLHSGQGESVDFESKSVEMSLGDHPLAQRLTEMGLPKAPFYVQWSERIWGGWYEPRRVPQEHDQGDVYATRT